MMKNSVDSLDAALEATIRGVIGKPEGDIYKSDLQRLTNLATPEKNISDLICLEYATGLTEIRFGHTRISDISPLANLTNLERLSLHHNQISDIEPLVNNPGLSQGDEVYLRNNPLSDTSVNTYVPQLEARGVHVDY
ncbi:MAG: hypothetical protein DRI01_02310 [Chloroflexi bacterium]|nr:MAG: hypothetical protein DRI01_02310 [Chloroflexota bacterium]